MDRKNPASFGTILLLVLMLLTAGCNGVRRRLTITSNPEGATVYLNDQEIGQTPVSQNIIYSGTYKIRLSKEGMETKTVMYDVRTPWYLWPGVDFVSENLVPGELRDVQTCHVQMEGKRVIPDNELLESAAAMRNETHDQAKLEHYQGTKTGLVPQVTDTTPPANAAPYQPIVNPPHTENEQPSLPVVQNGWTKPVLDETAQNKQAVSAAQTAQNTQTGQAAQTGQADRTVQTAQTAPQPADNASRVKAVSADIQESGSAVSPVRPIDINW